MTTFQGIAVTTQTLRYLVETAARRAVPGASTTTESPERQAAAARDEPRVSVFLVQVRPDPVLRNDDLPTRSAAGQLLTAPRASLTLVYLLTFFGPPATAQLMLGAVELAVHQHAYLEPGLIREAVAAHPELQGSGLEAQRPPVLLAERPAQLEEFSRIWSSFFQVPYTLATLYEASGVVLEADVDVAGPALVQQVNTGQVAPLARSPGSAAAGAPAGAVAGAAVPPGTSLNGGPAHA
jgi:hypothetical protein